MPDELDPKNAEQVKSRGHRIFASSKSSRFMIEERWRRSNDLYDSVHPRGVKTTSDVLLGQYRLFIPKTYNTLQRIHTDVMDTFFFDPEEVVGVGSTNKDISSERMQVVKAVLNHRIAGHPINFYQELFEATQDGLRNKLGIFKVYPKFRLKKVQKNKVKKVVDERGQETEMVEPETSVEIEAYEPQMDSVPPEDLFLSGMSTWKDYWKFPMIHRMVRSREYLRVNGYKNWKEAPGITDLTMADAVKEQRSRNSNGSPFFHPVGEGKGDYVVVYEFWDFMDLEKVGYEQSVKYSMLGDISGPTVMGLEPVLNTLPYKFSEFECVRAPFVIGQPFPESHKAYGKDLPEFTEGLQLETNSLRNQDREAAAISIRKPLLINRDANIDETALVKRKIGGYVKGDDISQEAVRELTQSSPIINTAQISRQIDQDYSEATSITPTQLGLSTKDETATGVTSTQVNANKKIQGVIRNYANTLVLPALQMLLRLEQAYESDEYIRQVTGKVLGWKLPNDGIPAWGLIQGDFELTVELGMNKQQQVNRYLLLMDRGNQANLALSQLLQVGAVKPGDIEFANPMWAYDQLLMLLKHKNVKEAKIKANQQMPPPAQPGGEGGGGPMGVASQPGANANPMTSSHQFNPEEFFAGLAE